MVIRPRQREVSINGARCARLAEFLGRFPVVALSSHDLQLVRGVPQARRRALDLALSSLDEKYFTALRRYHAALDNRNALLRGPRAPAPEALAAFEAVMVPEAAAHHGRAGGGGRGTRRSFGDGLRPADRRRAGKAGAGVYARVQAEHDGGLAAHCGRNRARAI